ncbi:MAG: hypothetical protein R3Y54_05360 [Eubacteriales bacterium]
MENLTVIKQEKVFEKELDFLHVLKYNNCKGRKRGGKNVPTNR